MIAEIVVTIPGVIAGVLLALGAYIVTFTAP